MENICLNEGINYNNSENTFLFDFVTNKKENLVIEFTEFPLEKLTMISPNGNNIYYFGYEFTKNTTSQIRSKFFNELRFNDNFTSKENKMKFIKLALDKLGREIGGVYDFDILIVPKSRSSLNQIISNIFVKMSKPKLEIIELIKELPKNIEFDFDLFEKQELNSIVNGKERYTEKQKQEQIIKIKKMLSDIHNSDYFSIAQSIKGNKYKQYFLNYLKLNNGEDFIKIRDTKKPILILDDVTTTGSTLFECLKTLRFINQTVDIILFTLIGKKEII